MLKPRFCTKPDAANQVFWSASPSAEAVDITVDAPFKGLILTTPALRSVVHHHHRANTEHPEGRRFSLAGAALTADAAQYAASRAREPLWAKVLETLDFGVKAMVAAGPPKPGAQHVPVAQASSNSR